MSKSYRYLSNSFLRGIFLLILILIIKINVGMAEIDNEFHGFPSYSIITYSDSPIVNQGEKVTISLYIIGAGDVDSNKIRISIPPYIVKGNTVESRIILLDQVKRSHNVTLPAIVESQFGTTLPEEFFKAEYGLTTTGEVQVGIRETQKLYAPITLDFIIDDSAPSGDHIIAINLLYKNGTQWYASGNNIKIHIRYWYEKTWFYVVSAAFLVISFIELLLKSEIYKKLHKFSHQKTKASN